MGAQLDKLVKEINKEWKEEIVAKGIRRIETKKIPFTSPRLNYMLYGGLPRGKIIEFAGAEHGGKTTTALDACKNAQKLFQEEWEEEIETTTDANRKKYLESRGPQVVVYADCENTLDEDWARQLGVDVDNMIIIKPQTQAAEDIFQMLLDMMETDEVGLVVVDSLGVMLSKQAYEKDMTEKTYGGIAMALTLFSKKAELICNKTLCTLIGINQMRDDMNSMYGGQTTTGGKAWKHNCFSANTEFITDSGIRKFKDFKDGATVTVVDMYGMLRQATVHHYGKQQLYKVVLRTSWGKQVIECTRDHRWVLEDGSVTTHLNAGDKLYFREENVHHNIDTPRKAEMFCLGMILADGCDYKSAKRDGTYTPGVKIVLCGAKSKYSDIFEMAGYRKSKETDKYFGYYKLRMSKQDFLNGECWKYLTPEDKRYLFMGYYAGDGATSGSYCCTYDERILRFIRDTSGMCGYYITSIKQQISDENSYKSGQVFWHVQFTTHQNKYNHWTVESITKTEIRGVYCVEEPVTHTFTLAKGIVTGNCALRVMFRHGDFIDENGNRLNKSCESPAGNKVMINIVKNKVTKPDRRVGYYTLNYTTGIDEIADLIEVAMKYGYVVKSGAWFNFCDVETGEIICDESGKEIKIQGMANLISFIEDDEVMLDELREQVYGAMGVA